MDRKVIVFRVGAAALAGGCVVLLHQLSLERSRVRALQDQVVQLEQRLESAVAHEKSSTEAASETPSATPEDVFADAKPGQGAPANVATEAKGSARHWVYLRNPEFRDAVLTRLKLKFRKSHADVSAWLGLSRTETEALIDLLAEQEVRSLASHALQPGKDRRAEKQREEDEIAQLLGYQNYQEWKQYGNAFFGRELVKQLNTRLPQDYLVAEKDIKVIAIAMTEAHDMAVAEARRARAARLAEGSASVSQVILESAMEMTHRADELAVLAAAPHLSAQQLEALTDMLNGQRMGREAAQQMERIRASSSDSR
jgi:hypothetical protein